MYKYVDKYFDFHERSKVWSRINSNEDVERIFSSCKFRIEMTREIEIKDRIRQDTEDGQKELAKIEIALRRIKEFPSMFSFTEKERTLLEERFNKFEQEIHQLDIQRISWD